MKNSMISRLCALVVAVFCSFSALSAVYLNVNATGGEGGATFDGKSWSTAYKTLPEAIAALKELPATIADRTLYVAQGTYQVTGSGTIPSRTIDCIALYGGYKADSDENLPGTRDIKEYQTIIGVTITGKWKHCVPNLGSYSFTSTTLSSEPVIKNGKINILPFTGDYDTYDTSSAGGDNSGTPMLMIEGTGGVVDGVSFVGCGRVTTGHAGCLHVVAGCTSIVVKNCNFVGNHPTQGCLYVGAPAAGGTARVEDCLVYGNGYLYSSSTSVVNLGAGVVMTGCSISGNAKGSNTYTHNGMVVGSGMVTNCVITHNTLISGGSSHNGISSVLGGGAATWVDCAITNNYSAYCASRGSLMHFTTGSLRKSLVANNRVECKPADGDSHFLFGFGGSTTSSGYTATIDGCLFVSNSVAAPAVAATSGSYALGLIGGYHGKSGYLLSTKVWNCQFEDNAIEPTAVAGVTMALSRGLLCCNATAAGTGNFSNMYVTNCTFRAKHQDGVYDIVQYGACTTHEVRVGACLFEETDQDVHHNAFYADNPSTIHAANCTIKNLISDFYPEGYDVTDGLYYDPIPFVRQAFVHGGVATDYGWLVPAAKTPGIRTTADGSVRGAVNALTATAENGATLTVRRSPFAGGTVSVPAQAVATGAAIAPVTATPVTGGSFQGWFEEGTQSAYSTANPLAIDALSSDLVLEARFATRLTSVTFDLNGAGTFDVSGTSATNFNLSAGATFPEVPAYTVGDNKHIYEWDAMPAVVPNEDVTYRAHWVTKDVRTIYVAPDGTGDGSSWANASGDLTAAYKNAGRCRGEVWLKEGTYDVTLPIEKLTNVMVRGGFVGTETRADEADPAAHPTILSGNRTTYYAFTDISGAPGDMELTGIVFKDFVRSTLDFALVDIGRLVVSNCAFAGCNTVKEDSYAAIDVRGEPWIFGTTFTNCYRALCSRSASVVTTVVENCGFIGVTGTTVGVSLIVGSGARVRGSSFDRGYGYAVSVSGPESGAANALVEDCSFTDGFSKDDLSLVALSGQGSSKMDIVRCRFFNNRYEVLSVSGSDHAYYTTTSAGCVKHGGKNSVFTVRDCSFVGNRAKGREASSKTASCVCATGAGKTVVENCAFENNFAEAVTNVTISKKIQNAGRAATLGTWTSNGKMVVANCTFFNNTCISATENYVADVFNTSSANTMYTILVNSILWNDEDDYVALQTGETSSTYCGRTVMKNFDREKLNTSSYTELGPVWTDDPQLKAHSETNALGLVARCVSGGSPYVRSGYPIWTYDGSLRIYNADAASGRQWPNLTDGNFTQSKPKDLTLQTPRDPDIFGVTRKHLSCTLGAYEAPPVGLILLVR